MKNLTVPQNYRPTTQPGTIVAQQGTVADDLEKPKTKWEKFSKNKFGKSVIDFFLTAPYMAVYFLVIPLVIHWIIGSRLTLPWCWVIAAILFDPVTGVVHYTWGEHWPVGKKIWGFTLVSFIVLAVSLTQIYYNMPTSAPNPVASLSQPVIELKKGDRRLYEISDDGYSPRIFVPSGVNYDLTATGGKPYEVVFDNGLRVAVVPGEPHINAPTVNPCIFRLYSREKQGILVEGS